MSIQRRKEIERHVTAAARQIEYTETEGFDEDRPEITELRLRVAELHQQQARLLLDVLGDSRTAEGR